MYSLRHSTYMVENNNQRDLKFREKTNNFLSTFQEALTKYFLIYIKASKILKSRKKSKQMLPRTCRYLYNCV